MNDDDYMLDERADAFAKAVDDALRRAVGAPLVTAIETIYGWITSAWDLIRRAFRKVGL